MINAKWLLIQKFYYSVDPADITLVFVAILILIKVITELREMFLTRGLGSVISKITFIQA